MDTKNPFPPIQIFRAGRHVDMHGRAMEFSESDLAQMARVYDPAKHKVPLAKGHPAHDDPAQGWVKSLSATGAALFAQPEQVSPEFAEEVSISVQIFPVAQADLTDFFRCLKR